MGLFLAQELPCLSLSLLPSTPKHPAPPLPVGRRPSQFFSPVSLASLSDSSTSLSCSSLAHAVKGIPNTKVLAPIPSPNLMASPPSSPMAVPPEPLTSPSAPSPSRITDGAISGRLPAAEAFAVHYPGYPSSPARAARTLGGLPTIAKVRSSDLSARLELRFRPEDPHCHPAFGEPRACTGLLLRLSRRKGTAAPCAEVVARVRTAYNFDGMADFQHVVPVHAAQMKKRKRSGSENDNENLDNTGLQETDGGDVMMLVPPLFSVKDRPTKIALLPSSNAISKSMHRGVVQERWEINWEDHIPKNSVDWNWQIAVCKLFDERPVWPRQSLYERLHEDGVQVSQNQFKRLLFRAGYYFSTGPFGKFWIRRGYDPRQDPESRMFQRIDFRVPPELRNFLRTKDSGSKKWADLCKLEAMPSQSFIFLQLCELKDDFIQEQIRKPSFLSLLPNEEAKNLLRDAHELIERSKKQEALWTSERSKGDKDADEEAPATHTETEEQVGPNNSDSEDVDDEEEEEELDGYDSPPMAEDVRDFTLDAFGEGFSNGYLEEVLRSFPLQEDGQNKSGDAPNNADASDGEFEIFEQPSDDEECSDAPAQMLSLDWTVNSAVHSLGLDIQAAVAKQATVSIPALSPTTVLCVACFVNTTPRFQQLRVSQGHAFVDYLK
ncbi:hypothetical protein U9M48_026141 [Paspalum notatum var. saurae]|uniref:Transcription factor IIIC subunit 5 HTH domain-containing protein n=1 Tax=Paspalum notatum var. saurae TaxID=547442 RepID=A0AAQ3TU08_PASNO